MPAVPWTRRKRCSGIFHRPALRFTCTPLGIGSAKPSSGSPPARCRGRRGTWNRTVTAALAVARPAGQRGDAGDLGDRLDPGFLAAAGWDPLGPGPRALPGSSAAGVPGLPGARLPEPGAAAGGAVRYLPWFLPAKRAGHGGVHRGRAGSCPVVRRGHLRGERLPASGPQPAGAAVLYP